MRDLAFERAALRRHVLHVAEEVEAPGAALAADAGSPRAPERRLEVAHEVAIHPDRAGDDSPRDPLGPRGIARVDHGREPVVGPVGQLDRLVLRVERLPGKDRSEDLRLDDLVALTDSGQDGRLVVETAALV